MILASVAHARVTKQGPVTAAERIARYGHAEAIVSLGQRMDLALRLERKLFDRGCAVAIANAPVPGLITLVVSDQPADRELSDDVDQIIAGLEHSGTLSRSDSLTGGEGI